jgi:putative peptidoglycan lipid II flippase
MALSCYAAGLAGYASLKVLVPAFYALNDARTPMLVSLFSVAVNFVAASYLVHTPLRHAGLALATSTVSAASFLILLWRLRTRIGAIQGGALLNAFWRAALAGGTMGVLCFAASGAIHQWLGTTHKAAFVDLGVCIPLGAVVYFALCRMLRVPGIDRVSEIVSSKLVRKRPVP